MRIIAFITSCEGLINGSVCHKQSFFPFVQGYHPRHTILHLTFLRKRRDSDNDSRK